MRCKKCNQEFVPRKGFKNYCGNQCKQSRNFTEESRLKKSKSNTKAWARGDHDKVNFVKVNNDLDKKNKSQETWMNIYKDRINRGEDVGYDTIRKYVLLERNERCEECGINEYNGKPITLEIHHIDGNNQNHVLNNLQVLCPNCHSQTHNFRVKNRDIEYNTVSELQRKTDFTYREVIDFHNSIKETPQGYTRKKDYTVSFYKIGATTITKLLHLDKKDKRFIELIDNNEDIGVMPVYKRVKGKNYDYTRTYNELTESGVRIKEEV